MRTRAVTAIVTAALATGVVAGCGSDDSSKDESTAAPTNTSATAPKASSGSKDSAPMAAKAAMKDFEFTPETVTVATGGKVTWTDMDSSNHNVKFDTSGAPEGISNLNKDETGSVKFAKAGTYEYVCTYHPNMHGTVVVR